MFVSNVLFLPSLFFLNTVNTFSSFKIFRVIFWEVSVVWYKSNLTHVLVTTMSENQPQSSQNYCTTPFFVLLF